MLIVYTTILVAGVILLVLLDRNILPNLASDHPDHPAGMAWLDIWLPLIFASPLAIILTFSGEAGRVSQAGWFAVGPGVAAGCLAIGIAHLFSNSVNPSENQSNAGACSRLQLATYRHCFILLLLGYLLIKIAEAASLAAWQGQVFITVAIIWMWMSSSEQPLPATTRSKDKNATGGNPLSVNDNENDNKNSNNKWLMLDWAGQLSNPIRPITKIVITLMILLLIAVCIFLNTSGLRYTVGLAVIIQCCCIVLVAIRLDHIRAIRTAISTMILSLTIGLGGMSMGLLIPSMRSILFPFTRMTTNPTHLLGLSAVANAGIILIGLSLYTLLCAINKEYFSKTAGVILILASILVFLSGSSDFMGYLDLVYLSR